jgi:hypothetical protein
MDPLIQCCRQSRNCRCYQNSIVTIFKSITLRLNNIDRFANTTFADILKADLNEPADGKRKLKEIDEVSVSQIFSLFKLSSENCKFDDDNFLRKAGLQCLNQIWKNYLPK